MKKYLILPALLLLLSPVCAVTPPEGFTALFNGSDLSGWHGNDPHTTNKSEDHTKAIAGQQAEFLKHWSVADGVLINNGKGPFATTDKDYGDFELMLEYKTVAKADNGIYLRGNPQVQIWDTTEAGGKWKHGANKGSGGLWNKGKGTEDKDPLVHADRAFGEWNQVHVRMLGSRVWVSLNKQLVVDGAMMRNYWSKGKTPIQKTGPIHLQTHGGAIHWRNIFIREIEAEEANQLLSELSTEGFESIFNGKNFTGWEGDVGQYRIVDDSLISLKGGTLFTTRTYRDFVFKLEFKLPPGGNNGLAIRYSGHGDPAYNGMCELQVLDNTAAQHSDLDARQYHGSVYGKAAAARGYLRPVGEWNYQVVRVQGTTIQVELNGTTIVDADLSTITEFMSRKFKANIPEAGHLGFAGHGAGVSFRNLWIRDGNKAPGCRLPHDQD